MKLVDLRMVDPYILADRGEAANKDHDSCSSQAQHVLVKHCDDRCAGWKQKVFVLTADRRGEGQVTSVIRP